MDWQGVGWVVVSFRITVHVSKCDTIPCLTSSLQNPVHGLRTLFLASFASQAQPARKKNFFSLISSLNISLVVQGMLR